MPTPIVLATLNAKYLHAALGLRYLQANMGPLQAQAEIVEFVIHHRPIDIAEQILARSPRIVGFGVYIWNAAPTLEVVAILKQVAPQTVIVLGGPEVSYEWQDQPIVALADYVLTGQADVAFGALCQQVLDGESPEKVQHCGEVPLAGLVLPYHLYTDTDVAQRLVYVEASRGCPFKCSFCLSSLDVTSKPFDLDLFLAEMATLHDRGVRHFKFVDRTFNLAAATSVRILTFFLARLSADLFLHFELIPDRLPEPVKALLAQFPPGCVQLEIGVQTFDPVVQAQISRRQDNAQTETNLRWLRAHTQAHLHVDLIVGLPGEDLATFGRGFDRLVACHPHEIQIGILKRLRGTPIVRDTDAFAMRYNPHPPYNLLANSTLSFADMQRMTRFARFFDLIVNSGRFGHTRAVIFGDAPFARFLQLADWMFGNVHQTHEIALERLFRLLLPALRDGLAVTEDAAKAALLADYATSGLRGTADFLRPMQPVVPGKAGRSGKERQGRFVGEPRPHDADRKIDCSSDG